MKKDIQKQFDNMRNVGYAYTRVLRCLLGQVDTLEPLITQLGETEEGKRLKKQFKKAKKDIDISIDMLVDRTEDFAVAYANLSSALER